MIKLPIEIGDVVLTGRFKNHPIRVKKIGTSDIGQPTVNGRQLLAVRIEKLLPEDLRKDRSMDKKAEFSTNVETVFFNELEKIALKVSTISNWAAKRIKGAKNTLSDRAIKRMRPKELAAEIETMANHPSYKTYVSKKDAIIRDTSRQLGHSAPFFNKDWAKFKKNLPNMGGKKTPVAFPKKVQKAA